MKLINGIVLFAAITSLAITPARAQLTVLCEGDSITYGTYVSTPYPSRLARNTGHRVINAGLGGERCSGGLARISSLLATYDPWVVCILYGTNDINDPNQDLHASAQVVLQIAQQVRSYGALPIIGTVPPQVGPSAFRQSRVVAFNSYLRSYASAYGIRLADIQAAFGSGSGLMVFDGFHPNDTGAEIIAQTFAAKIPPLVLKPSTVQIPATGAAGRTVEVGTRLTWTAVADQPWIVITSGGSGAGNGTVTYSVAENIGPARTGAITVTSGAATMTLTVNQSASPYLKISSPHGTPVPAVGTLWVRSGTVTNAAIDGAPVLNGTTQYVFTGWAGTGSAPKSGPGTDTGLFAVTNNTTVSWLWKTNFWLETAALGSGTVNVASGWFAKGSNVSLKALPGGDSRFFRWTGSQLSTASNIVVSMTSAKSAFAWFGVNVSVQARGLDGSTRAAAIQAIPADVFQKASGNTPSAFGYTNGAAVEFRAPGALTGGWKLVGWTGVDAWNGTSAWCTARSESLVTALYDPPPSVTITSPTVSSGWTTSTNVMNIGGSAASPGGLLRVEVSNARAERNRVCAGTTNWTYEGLTLYPGVNLITVTAYDIYSNAAVDTLSVKCTKDSAVQGLAMLAGAVVRDIQMPDNLVPGSVCTVQWQVESYEPVLSGLKIRLPEGPGVTNVTLNGRLSGTSAGTWAIGGLRSRIYSFEADWIVPNRPGTCRVRFPAARQDGFAYVNANIPDGVDAAPYGTDGKEIARTIAAGGAAPALQSEPLTRDAKPFENFTDAQRRAGVVIRDIQIPDNLVPGSIVTCKWTVLSYPAAVSRLRMDLPSENDATGLGVLKGTTNSVWRMPKSGAVVEYDGTVSNDAPGPVPVFYKMSRRDLQYLWTVPNDPGVCRISFEAAPANGVDWIGGVLREGVDGRIEANHSQIVRDIEDSGEVPLILAPGVTNNAGNIQYFGDADWYEFTVGSAGTYQLQTYPGTLKDTIMKLYGPGNRSALIAQNDNAVGKASQLILPLNPGTYYIKITAPLNLKGTYKILAAPSP